MSTTPQKRARRRAVNDLLRALDRLIAAAAQARQARDRLARMSKSKERA